MIDLWVIKMKKAHQFPKTAFGSCTSTVGSGGTQGTGTSKGGGSHKANQFPTTAIGYSKMKKKG